MSDTPPPLPLDTPLGQTEAIDEGRVAPPHAPLFWRSMAFLADALLIGMIGYVATSLWLMPWLYPKENTALHDWVAESWRLYHQAVGAMSAGRLDAATSSEESLGKWIASPSTAVESAISFQASSMMFFFWLGFAGMEIATKGASLGKKIFRLRVARFPHGEEPTLFDSLIRSCWKALAISSVNPLVAIFAIVDAHWPLFNPLRRSLHDLFSRTIVLDARFDEPKKDKPAKRDEG